MATNATEVQAAASEVLAAAQLVSDSLGAYQGACVALRRSGESFDAPSVAISCAIIEAATCLEDAWIEMEHGGAFTREEYIAWVGDSVALVDLLTVEPDPRVLA